jgi:hypothetical protein
MNILFKTKQKALTIMIEVITNSPQKIQVVVKDINKPNTDYTNRHSTINGTQRFFVRMPISPYEALISVYNTDKIENDKKKRKRKGKIHNT